MVQRGHRSGRCLLAYGNIRKRVELQIADIVRQNRDLFERTVLLLHCLPIASKVFWRWACRMLGQRGFAVVPRQVPVGAHISHLLGQQAGKGCAIRYGVIIAVLLVRQQRIRHFLPNVRVNVVLLQIRDRSMNHALTLRCINPRDRTCRVGSTPRLQHLLFQRFRGVWGRERRRL